ncbi:MAG: S1C family serine protease, partial [Hyphomonadaceae bacterium]|nr:S1C family serine protease [Hyphomonadaceae bacterium]
MLKRLALVVAAAWGVLLGPAQAQQDARRAPASGAEVKLSLAPIVREASPAVVNVYAQRVVRQVDPWMQFFGQGQPQERVQQSLGSGVLVRADGVVVTNNHVIQGAERLKVVLADRREFDAKLLLADPKTDLAVLRLEGVG